jgi:hypothetical protein
MLAARTKPLPGGIPVNAELAFSMNEKKASAGSIVEYAYDADKETMTVSITANGVCEGESLSDSLQSVDLAQIEVSTRKYVASNAYGVKAVVQDSTFLSYGLAFRSSYLREKDLSMEFKVPLSQAPIVKRNLRVAVVVRLLMPKIDTDPTPVINGQMKYKATISDPYAGSRSRRDSASISGRICAFPKCRGTGVLRHAL